MQNRSPKQFAWLSPVSLLSACLLVHGSTTFAAEEGQVRKPLPSAAEVAKLPPDGGEEFNRLVFEQSPYLLQHARNPVDWHAWNKEAFQKAREEDKPVFLSVGYSTCHWCHVMEHQSFEDDEVAGLMNKYFISIKVDREERPDVDDVYMDVTRAISGRGGWPMTVVMTPDKKPFFAGTYFPKHGRFGRKGMMQLLPELHNRWVNERSKVVGEAENHTRKLQQTAGAVNKGGLDAGTLQRAFDLFKRRFDRKRGGFLGGNKFPVPHNLRFLLRYWYRTGDADALNMAEKTLLGMRLGGIYDHVGLGIHRYSTDPNWLLPHFEKMLYDQALLAMAHIEAYQATGKALYVRTAREIFTYVLRDMTSPEGGFYSAEDADSEGEEGKFYVWDPKELNAILGKEDAELYIKVFNIVEGGNFLEQSTRKTTGFSIPHLKKPLDQVAAELEVAEAELRPRLDAMRRKLFAVREKRIHPLKDDKVLTDWNGLMIAAMSKAAQALDDDDYRAAASRAADFVLARLRTEDGRLLKRYRQGEAGLPAHLEDYSFMVWGLINLYEATFDERYLREALSLNAIMLKHFWDDARGGFFTVADDGEKLLVRRKDVYDGAIPSGNSVAALNLIRLGRITANEELENTAEAIMTAFANTVNNSPSGYAQLLMALEFAVGPSFEVIICGSKDAVPTDDMFRALNRRFIPNKVVLFRDVATEPPPIAEFANYTTLMRGLDPDAATAYVCQNFACDLPTTSIDAMLQSLDRK